MTPPPSKFQRILCLPGKVVSWLIVPLILSVIGSVIAARFGLSVLIDWEGRIPFFGQAFTVNSLVDLQWYIFAVMVLFGGIWALIEHRHVTVDFLAVGFRGRTRGIITILGNIVLLLPFCALMLRYGWDFAAVAWRTGEASNQGGLAAHYLVKAAVPLGFALLGLAGLVQAFDTLRALRRGTEGGHDAG